MAIRHQSIVVWFSCGAASAVAAKKTVERYGDKYRVRVINNPVLEEDDDNRRFLKEVEQWIGQKIEIVTHSKYRHASAANVWDDESFMSGPKGAPCTRILKKGARQQWENENKAHWHVLGFTADEEVRHDRFVLTERSNVIPVLIDAGITKKDCFDILAEAGIAIPRVYRMGYPNANCIGCVKATSATYWNHVRKMHPEVFMARAAQSRRLGAKLVRYKGVRIFLDELPVDAKGQAMKNIHFDCNSFCEELPHARPKRSIGNGQ